MIVRSIWLDHIWLTDKEKYGFEILLPPEFINAQQCSLKIVLHKLTSFENQNLETYALWVYTSTKSVTQGECEYYLFTEKWTLFWDNTTDPHVFYEKCEQTDTKTNQIQVNQTYTVRNNNDKKQNKTRNKNYIINLQIVYYVISIFS